MANEKFRVKYGLAVGDNTTPNAMTVDGTTGDITSNGSASIYNVTLNGGEIKSTGGTTAITVSGNSATIAGDIEIQGQEIKSNGGTTAITLNGADISTGDITLNGGDIRSNGGTVAVSVSGANATVAGDLAVNGGSITTTQTTANIVNATATTVNIAGAATTVSIGANTGTTTVNNSLVADDISITTVDTTNLEVTNIKSKDGVAAASIADGTGIITVSTELNVDNINIKNNTISTIGANNLILNTNGGTSSGSITITQGAAGNINITPAGTGDVYLESDTVYVGDSGAAATITTNGAGNLVLNTNNGSNSGSITIAQGANGNITLAPNVNGDVILDTDTVQIEQKLTTIGANNLILNTNNGTNSGEITITQGSGGNITITPSGNGRTSITQLSTTSPRITTSIDDANGNELLLLTATALAVNEITLANASTGTNPTITASGSDSNVGINIAAKGTGNTAFTFNNGGNLTNSRNYVYGGIRNATTQSIGDIWALNSTGPTVPVRGISIDNSVDTTKNAGLVLRQGSNGAASPARVVFERSRGTVGTPTVLQSGDSLGLLNYTGYTSTGWLNDNIAAVSPATINMTTTENWVSNTNLGTNFSVALAPSATTITSGANLITAISHSPQSATYRSDAFTFQQGKTGTTNLLTLGTASSTLKAKNITFQDTSNAINNVLVTAGDPAGATFNDRVAQIRQFSAITNTGEASTMTFQSARYNTGTAQYSPTQSGDEIGTFFFNGNYNTGATTAVNGPAARFGAKATETWTVSANGGRFYVETINTGTTTSTERMSLSNTEAKFRSDAFTIQNAAGTALTSAAVNYTRTYGEFAYTGATFNIAAQNTIFEFPLDTTINNSGVTISNTSRININVAGWYKIIMSLQIASVHNNPISFDFWLRKTTGSISPITLDVDNSKTQIDLLKDQKMVVAMDWLVYSNGSNNYWEIVYACPTAGYADISFPTIAATTTPYTSPLAPALIVNVIPIGM